jgi:Reverse transcriptase (RNA-dependent DNA polymerase)
VEFPIGNERNKVGEATLNVNENAKKNANERVVFEMKKLKSWFNLQATKVIEDYDCGRKISLEEVNLALFTTAFIKEPLSFEEAISCEKKGYQDAWKDAIDKEFSEMTKRGIGKSSMKNMCQVINVVSINKWIFKVKRYGVFCARLVACGYSQGAGVDFTESFAPVVDDVSFRLMPIAKLVWDMNSTVLDIETAFLDGDLDEGIYMDVPMGLSTEPNKKLLLRKTIYGLVQSARKFYKKLVDVLKVI